MGFYDSVKENVRRENEHEPRETGKPVEEDETTVEKEAEQPAGSETGGEGMPFDQLKNNAEQYGDKKDANGSEGDDTQIEVLTEEGLQPADNEAQAARNGSPSTQPSGDVANQQPQQNPDTGNQHANKGGQQQISGSGDEDVLDALQALQQQNSEMLDVLRGIKRTLEQQ